MSWIKKHDNWLGQGQKSDPAQSDVYTGTEKSVLTVAQAAEMLGVDIQTIKRKYLALDPEDDAPIPFDGWFRLPGGHIRIYRYIIVKIQKTGQT